MEDSKNSDWSGEIDKVQLGATKSEGGTRAKSYRIGGERDLPFIKTSLGEIPRPLIAFEICDDREHWPPVVLESIGDLAQDVASWTAAVEKKYGADLVRIYLTSTKRKNFADFPLLRHTIEEILEATDLPLIIEGSNEPSIDSEVFQVCGEAGEGERLLLGTAEAGRYRSVAAAALAYNHSVIAQSPIDINLAKQLNILLHEIGVPHDHIVIDPYTGSLGYGFEYSYSVMERIRTSALKGDSDLGMPMISSAIDSLNVREVRDAPTEQRKEIAIIWEFFTALSAAVAGADIVCVRHPDTVQRLKEAFASLTSSTPLSGSVPL